MFYPEYLKKGDTIGICAPSAGVGRKLESFGRSIEVLQKQGYKVIETESVRVNNVRSTTGEKRAEEFHSLLLNDEVDMVMCAAGGDYLVEMLPYLNKEIIVEHPKWVMGASDPTTLLYYMTTKLDIATLYGLNGGSYDVGSRVQYVKNNLQLLQGKSVVQKSFAKHEGPWDFSKNVEVKYTRKTVWKSDKDFVVEGRFIGGCIDTIINILGTKFDGTREFVERYKEDGIIWYFDNFSLDSDTFYRALWQLKEIGAFEGTKAVVLGRVLFPKEGFMSYEAAMKEIFGDIPFVTGADVGHVHPSMTLINGAIGKLEVKEGKGSIEFVL